MFKYHKVNRCHNRQPTVYQMSRQGLYVPKKAYFGTKMAVFGPNILIILGGSKSSGTHISENHFRIDLLAGHGTKWIRKANI